VNVRALRQRQPEGEALQRYRQVARLLTNNPEADETDGVKYLQELCTSLRTQPLRAFGVRQVDFPELIEKASKASSMKGNPIVLAADEMREILELAW
jgi:alcohol dehydrogenase class IV